MLLYISCLKMTAWYMVFLFNIRIFTLYAYKIQTSLQKILSHILDEIAAIISRTIPIQVMHMGLYKTFLTS